jgi:hypothetical protein
MKYIGYITVAFIVLVIIVAVTTDPDEMMRDIQTDVANDFIEQYEMAQRHGSDIDVCVRSGLVAEGFLQAGNEQKYAEWRGVQRQDCEKAGMPVF